MSEDAKKAPFLDQTKPAKGAAGSPLSSLGKGRSETTDSWGDYVPPDRKSQGQEGGKPNPFTRFRSDLEETARRISQRRIDALQADAAICVAKTTGDDTALIEEKGKPPIRRSRTEAANSASEAGVNHKLIAGADKNLPTPNQPTRRKSLVKQDATLEYFRDRRPNKHSGFRRPITNVQNVFTLRWKTVLLLWLIGAATGCVHNFVAQMETYILDGRRDLTTWLADNYGTGAGLASWWGLTTTVMLISLAVTLNISPIAAGSGIPQMKTQLTGVTIKNYLAMKTLVAKVFGLILSVGAGMYIGQEGPFVHIASALAECFIRLEGCGAPFRRIKENKPVRLAILEAACAVGVSSTFRSPIGGVLFSIEVTSTYYMVANYWKGFLAAISASLMSHLIDVILTLDLHVPFDPLYYVDYTKDDGSALGLSTAPYLIWELPIFIALGIVLGYAGSVMVRLNASLSRIKSKVMTNRPVRTKEIIWTIMVATITSSCYLFGNFSLRTYSKNVKDLVTPEPLDIHVWSVPPFIQSWGWGDLGVCFPLIVFFLSNLVLVSLSLTVAVPCGCFVPLFAGGAAFGRAVGEIVQVLVPDATSVPAGYGLVGAAAFTAGGTRTVSVAVIAMELTGELEFILPLFLGVFASCITGSRYSPSIYDSILKARNLPFLPNVTLKPNLVVSDIMTKNVPHLEKECSTLQMIQVLRQTFAHDIPLVESKETMLLHGTVYREEVEEVVRQFYAEHNLANVDGDIYMGTGAGDSDGAPRVRLSPEEREKKKELLSRSHDLLHHREIHVQAAPFILQAQTPAEDVHIIFTMLKCNGVFVTSYGMLVGVVMKKNLFDATVKEDEEDDPSTDVYASLRLTPSKRQSGRGELKRGGGSQRNVFSSIFSSSGSERSSGMKMRLAAEGALEDGKGGGIRPGLEEGDQTDMLGRGQAGGK